MAKQFIKIKNASNEEADQMFSAICKDVIKQDVGEVKEMLGIPKATPATIKDLMSLIQDSKVECEIIVYYDDATAFKQAPMQKEAKKEESPKVATEKPAAKGSESLPF